MGSLWFEAVKFYVYTRDHTPPHVHARYGENSVILELLPGGGVALSQRRDALKPADMKRPDLRRVVRMAIRHEAELRELWSRSMASELTDEEWEAPLSPEMEMQIDRALANARDWDDCEIATAASFDMHHKLLLIELKTGQRLAIPQEDLQEIAGADPADLADVEMLGGGTALHFEKIREGVEIDALRRGIYGNERWMDGLAQRRRERLIKAS